MEPQVEKEAGGFGLLATGSSHAWDFAIDESLERTDQWSAELEGPNVYLVFQIQDLSVIAVALDFLRHRRSKSGGSDPMSRAEGDDSLTIGRFGQASVSLVWDDEERDRCFLVVGPKARSTLRLTFQGEDISMLIEALSQVVEDLENTEGPA